MADIPSYKPRVKIGSLRQTTKKMMVSKVSGAKVGDPTVKKFLKDDKGLRRMAYGGAESTVESWKGRHFMKEAKEKIEASGEFRESLYGRKNSGERAFRDTVKEEIRQEQAALPTGPSKDELAKKKRLDEARGNLRKYEQAREIEKEQGGRVKRQTGPDPEAPVAGAEPVGAAANNVKLAGGGGRTVGRPADDAARAVVPVGSMPGATQTTPAELPDIFGLRGRILRVDTIKPAITVRILNAPAELAIFIGRDRVIKIPSESRCWKDRHTVPCTDLVVGDLVDCRGKVLNAEFLADEVFINGGELPDFVLHARSSEPTVELPTAAPEDLSIG